MATMVCLGHCVSSSPPRRNKDAWCISCRNVVSHLPKRVKGEIGAELAAIWQQPDKANAQLMLEAFKVRYEKRYPEAIASLKEGEEQTLTFYDFPVVMHR